MDHLHAAAERAVARGDVLGTCDRAAASTERHAATSSSVSSPRSIACRSIPRSLVRRRAEAPAGCAPAIGRGRCMLGAVAAPALGGAASGAFART